MAFDITAYPTMNPTFAVTEVESSDSQATLVIEPLEQGYGHTIGNALRRVLLSSLPGTAITKVRIDGVDHQFTTLEGMTEDVVELILNLKQIRIKADSTESAVLKLDVSQAGQVTGADINCPAGYEVANKDQVIATLADKSKLSVEMTVESGVGYVMATDQPESSIVGEIPVDALFSPVIKVNYAVEATRVGRRTDFDKVVLEVTTDGTIRPLEAVQQAAQILTRQFGQIVKPQTDQDTQDDQDTLTPEEQETLSLTVEELELPTRIANALRRGGFKTVGDLQGAPRTVIAKVKNLGEKSVDVINEALMKKGVTLGE